MPRKRGDHNQPYKTKKAIIEYLINQPAEGLNPAGMADEPVLRAYLKDKFDISDQKNIKSHLKDLLNAGCIKKDETPGLANKWLISDIKHIRKIVETFKYITPILNKSEVAINLVRDSVLGKERIQDLYEDSRGSVMFYTFEIPEWFKLSPSFFEFCLNYKDIETIESRWKEYTILNTGFGLDGRLMVNGEGKRTYRRDDGTDANFFEGVFFDAMENIFEHCVLNDVLNGRSNPDAKKYIEDKRINAIEKNEINNLYEPFYYNRAVIKTIFPEAEMALNSENNKALDEEAKEKYDNLENPNYWDIPRHEYLRQIQERLEKRYEHIHEIVKDMKPDVKNLIGFRFTISDIMATP